MKFAKTLNRDEMKNIMAGRVWVECDGCNNSTCQGWADDCESGAYEMCGPGRAGTPGPAPSRCVEVR